MPDDAPAKQPAITFQSLIFGKDTAGRNTAERVIGSRAFAALARMVLVTVKQDDSDLRVFARVKWDEALEGSARSLLGELEGDDAPISEKNALKRQPSYLPDTAALERSAQHGECEEQG